MVKVDYSTICLPANRIAVSDDSYFKKDYGPDEGDGPNYAKIADAMERCGAIKVGAYIFDLNGHSESEIIDSMAKLGFYMDMDEDFCECMWECYGDFEDEEDEDDEDE